MAYEKEIRQSIERIARSNNRLIFHAIVQSVNGDVCTVEYGNTTLTDVRLTAISDVADNAIIVKPKVGSAVVVADLSLGNMRDLVVIQYSSIASITINGGNLGGLVIGSKLADWMNKVAQDLQTLSTLLQSTPVAGNGAPLGVMFNPQTSTITTNDLENSNIKHG